MKQWNRILAVMLSLALVLSGFGAMGSPLKAQAAREITAVRTSTATEIDPSTLNGFRLAAIPEQNVAPDGHTYAPDEIVRVSIWLETPSVMDAGFTIQAIQAIAAGGSVADYREMLQRQQAEMAARISAAIGCELNVIWNLTLLNNTIAADVRFADIKAISQVEGVQSVNVDYVFQAEADGPQTAYTNSAMTFATGAWAGGYTGAGSKIAIIDTGVEDKHQSFDSQGLEFSLQKEAFERSILVRDYMQQLGMLTEDRIAELAPQLNAPIDAASAYRGMKVPFAYNYASKNYQTDHSDGVDEHGSHVAGIAAANRYIKVNGKYVDAASNFLAIGAAPDAQIIAMRVFAGKGAAESDYMAAIEDAIILGCDAANLSLGSVNGFAFSRTNLYQDIMNRLSATGMTVAISIGNAYAFNRIAKTEGRNNALYQEDLTRSTAGSPGTYVNSLSVASADNIALYGMPMIFNGEQAVFYNESLGSEDAPFGNPPIVSIAGTYDYIYLDDIGSEEQWAELGDLVKGKIAICNRGEISFYVKANGADAAGAAAVVIANNTDESLSMNLTGYTGKIPAVLITLKDAEALKASSQLKAVNGLNVYTGTVEVTGTMGDYLVNDVSSVPISEFSSWGVPSSLLMKPEITAPGGEIYSVNGNTTDGYEVMSGTSMAAPHVAGLAAILGQYLRENADRYEGKSARFLTQSLLMSTAVPMKDADGLYYPIMQQGAGLANVLNAVSALSYLSMDADATGSWADGKVKVELGQDAARTGKYAYTFYLTNTGSVPLIYDLKTDLFTQSMELDANSDLLQSMKTAPIDAAVTYDYERFTTEGRDVNRDGNTDYADVQAILDVVTGVLAEAAVSKILADMDEDGRITSYDAHLFIKWLAERGVVGEDQLYVPAGTTARVSVSIELEESTKAFFDNYYENGAYIEGFTYAECVSETEDGGVLDTTHSIPILGVYGSWTDSSMYDNARYEDNYYGFLKYPYTADITKEAFNSNALVLKQGNLTRYYIGNPYTVDEASWERGAVSGEATLTGFFYTLIRNAGTVAYVISSVAEDGTETVLDIGGIASNVQGAYYDFNAGNWVNDSHRTLPIGRTAADLGLKEGDTVSIGMVAIPEYYAMKLNGTEDYQAGTLSKEQIASLLDETDSALALGGGAFLGYTVTIDSTKPALSVEESEDGTSLSVTVQDNQYLAAVILTDVTGENIYFLEVPEQEEAGKEIRLVIDLEELGMTGADLVVLAGDYAGNERAILLSHGDKLKVRTYAYVLTDTIEDGGEYIIANSITPGRAAALASQGTDAFTASRNVTVKFDETYGIHIPVESADDSFVWGAIATPYGAALYNLDDYGFLGYVQLEYPYVDWSDPGYADFFGYDAENHALINTAVSSEDAKYYVAYSQGYYLYTMTPGLVGLYEKKAFEQEMTLEELMSVSVTPEEGLLPVGEELQLTAEVTPAYLDDLTVSWSSSDPDVATVSADGVVKALSPGTVTITAASHENPSVKGEAVIRVEASKSLDVILYGNIETAEGPQFAAIDFGVRLTGKVGDAAKTLLGGGRAGNYLYGVTVDESYERYDLTDEFKATAIVESLNMAYAVADAAAFPAMVLQEEAENDDSDAPIFPLEFDSVSVLPNKEWFALWQGDDLWYFPTQELYGFNLVALAYAGNLDNNLFYYGLGDDEHLYLLIMLPGIYEDEDTGEKYADVDLMPIDLGVVPGLSIDEASFAYSLSYIYEQTDEEDLILADNTNQTFWKINVGENEEEETVLTLEFLWKAEELLSVSALFNNDWDAETSLKAAPSPMIKALSAKPAAGTVRAQKAQLPAYPQSALTAGRPINPHADEIRRAQVLVEAPAAGAARVIAPEEAGTLSIVPDVQELVGFVTVSLTETEKTANGFIEIEYDPNEIDFLGIFTGEDAPYYSVNLIEGENGNVVRFAFASLTALEEETAVAMAVFQPHCEDAELTFRVLERGADTAVEETETAQTPGTGHDWEEPSYEWNEDHTEMTATRICRNDPEHKETEVVKSTAEVTVDPTCEGTGVRVYTALFENEAFETQTFEEEIEALGHDWDEPDYEWNEDHTEMTATRICKNDPEHKETEKVQAEKTTVDPTCTEDGKNTYTAVFENEGFETQVYEEVIAAIGHDWDEGTVTKEPGPAENGILHHVCRNDASHTFDEEIPATGVVDPPETGEDDGLSLWALVLAAALTALGLQTYVVRKFELGENDR